MNFVEAIKSVFSNYTNFNGRASRSEYNYWFLFCIILGALAEFINPTNYSYDGLYQSGGVLGIIFTIVLFLPGLAVGIRRLHDINKSGWNYLWYLTIIGIFPLIYWQFFKAGDNHSNSYGISPLSVLDVNSESVTSRGTNDVEKINLEIELKKYKNMLDDGLINQDDYDAKKKELLNL